LSDVKRRPALVLADAGGNALLLCQITSQAIRDEYAVKLDASHFQSGSLAKPSFIRPNRIFSADEQIVLYCAGKLKSTATDEVILKLIGLLNK
jgi:mRNA interferase MazF